MDGNNLFSASGIVNLQLKNSNSLLKTFSIHTDAQATASNLVHSWLAELRVEASYI